MTLCGQKIKKGSSANYSTVVLAAVGESRTTPTIFNPSIRIITLSFKFISIQKPASMPAELWSWQWSRPSDVAKRTQRKPLWSWASTTSCHDWRNEEAPFVETGQLRL